MPVVVPVVQEDSGRILSCIVADMELKDTYSARIYAVKPDKKEVYNDCVINGNTVETELTSQLLAEIGGVGCQIRITNEEAKAVSSFPFTLDVKKSLMSSSAIESSNEFSALDQALNNTKESVYEATADYLEAHSVAGQAQTGQFIVVKAVDENGKITEIEASDPPGSGSVSREEFDILKKQIADYDSLTLGVNADDGLIYLYKNNSPMGNGIPMASGGDVVGYIDSDNNIILSGALAEGTYTVKYEKEDGTTVDIGTLTNSNEPEIVIVNQIPISQNADGSLFVGTNDEKGYKTGYRISGSSGAESSQSGTEVTGYIPVTFDSTVYVKGIIDDGSHVMGVYDANHTKLITTALGNVGTFNGGVVSFKMSSSAFSSATSTNFAFIRISATEITEDSIVTVNQPIS